MLDKKLILTVILIVMVLFSGCEMEDAPTDCNELEDSFLSGRDDCWTNQAEDKKDVAICEKIGSETKYAACIGRVAAAKNQVGFCTRISDEENKKYCAKIYLLKNLDLEINHCDNLHIDPEIVSEKKAKDTCFTNLAVLSQDPNVCRYTSNPNSCVGKMAAQFNSERLCNEAPDPGDCILALKQTQAKSTEELILNMVK